MTALAVYLQNSWFRLKERQEGQTMAEYALILGLIAIFVMVAVFFLGGKIKDLFNSTGSSVAERAERPRLVAHPSRRGGGRRAALRPAEPPQPNNSRCRRSGRRRLEAFFIFI